MKSSIAEKLFPNDLHVLKSTLHDFTQSQYIYKT